MPMNNMTRMPKTVNERMKLNGGIIAGPNHKLSNQRIMSSMEEEEPETEGPPNLRDTERMDSCATCTHYAGMNCKKYSYDVKPSDICDAHAKVGKVDPEDMDATVEMEEESEEDE
jgi:hypothetical protein